MKTKQKIIITIGLGILLIALVGVYMLRAESSRAPRTARKENGELPAVSMVDNKFELNGQPWFPKSMQFIGLNCAGAYTNAKNSTCAAFIQRGFAQLGPTLFETAHQKWGVDLFEFALNEEALDASDTLNYDPTYISYIASTTNVIESMGYPVLLWINGAPSKAQEEGISAMTTRADVALAEAFGANPGVMISPTRPDAYYYCTDFNHPIASEVWNLWLNGGTDPNCVSGQPMIGTQSVINDIRDAGSKNVLIIDGPAKVRFDGIFTSCGNRSNGSCLPTDPLNQYAFGVYTNPYFTKQGNFDTPMIWQKYFGFFIDAGEPVISINRVGLGTGAGREDWCSQGEGVWQLPTEAFAYWTSKALPGLGGFAFDDPQYNLRVNSANEVSDFNGTPTSFYDSKTGLSYDCNAIGGEAGILDQTYLLAHAAGDTTPPATPTDLHVVSTTNTSVTLSWKPSTDTRGGTGIAGYTIYRNGSFAGMTVASSSIPHSTVAGTTTFTDTGLTKGTTYSYTVDAFDWASNHSAQSASVQGELHS